jgi:hypothetical protein
MPQVSIFFGKGFPQKKGGIPIFDGSTKQIIRAKEALQTLFRGIPVANGDEWWA